MATVNGTSSNDILSGTDRDDSISGFAGNDTLNGGGGNDTLNGAPGSDILIGGAGDDTIFGGGDNDVLNGGAGADTIFVAPAAGTLQNTTVIGGSGGRDDDTLDISALLAAGFEITNIVQNPENNGSPGFNGQIQLRNPATGLSANINFADIETFVVCFAAGTRIATKAGERPIETLRPGDDVVTRDNGYQQIRWIGEKRLSSIDLMVQPQLQPIIIKAGALGADLPAHDLYLSPNHQVLMAGDAVELNLGEREVFAAAKHLTGHHGVFQSRGRQPVRYFHMLLDRHEVVLSNGLWSESFHTGDVAMSSLDTAQRDEIYTLFPELVARDHNTEGNRARTVLRKYEAAMIARARFGLT